MKLSQFKFKLPEELIAQYPVENRDECRLMVVNSKTGEITHHIFKELINFFDEGDVLIFNDTKVFPARLYGNKEKTGACIEVFLLRELNEEHKLWDVLVEPARKIRIGNKLYFGEDDSMVAEVLSTIPPHVVVHSVSFTTVRKMNSKRLFMLWAKLRFRSISPVRPNRRMPNVISASLRKTKEPSWHRLPDFTSVAS